jgi:hypothetical protein
MNWSAICWRVDVQFRELRHRIRPIEHLDSLGPTRLTVMF